MKEPEPMGDDELFDLIGGVGAAINAARDSSIDPTLREMAEKAAELGAAKLPKEKKTS
ncbi:hypothetical protein ACWD4G_42025 [Streptomyces sp. NPDC002643]